jgi:hypothetical protein
MDAAGRTYLDLGTVFVPATEAAARRGVAYVYRVTPGNPQVDSVVELRIPVRGNTPGGNRSGPTPPYQPRDAWAVAADGRIAVVRQAPYRVEWIGPQPTRTIAGPIVPAERIRVGPAEREAYLDQMMGAGDFAVVQGGQSRAVRPPRPDAGQLP